MRRWYVINTKSNAEARAANHLNNQFYSTFLPLYLKKWNHARKMAWVLAPMFPRYLFVNLDLEMDQWRSIRSTIGVAQLISHGDQPTPVPEGVVESIKARANEGGVVKLGADSSFKRGDRIEVMFGAMADHFGIFDCADEQHRVFVLLSMMGRQVKVRLPRDAIRAAI